MAIFSLITTGLGALFGSTVIGNLVGGALAFGAKLGLSKLGQRQQKKQKFTAVQGEVQLGGDVPVDTLLGIGKTRGQRLYYAKWGKGNKMNADVFALANGWCDGLEPYIFMYGQKYNLVPKAVAGGETARYSVEGFIDGDGNSSIDIRFYDGRPDQVHDAELVAATAALGNAWKATSRLRGVCYVVVYRYYHLQFFRDAGRGRPEIEWMLRGLREYDPTKDSTVAGGNGPQRLNDPSTHVHTLNPAIHRLNYQLGLKGLLSGRTLIGEGKTLGQIDLSSYFVAINYCRTLRKGKPIYQCSLWVNSDTDHTEALSAFDDAMAGYGLNRRGLSGVVVGAPQIPVLTITDADIPSDRPKPRQPRKSAFDLFNHLSGQFTSPDSMWNPESLKPIVVNADVAADKRARQTSIDFLQVHDADIAQYLLNVRYRQNRKGGTMTLPVSRRVGLKVMEGEWVTYQDRSWMVSEWRCDADLRFTFVLTETGADIYDDGEIEPGPVIIPPTPPINPSQLSVVQNFAVTIGVIAGAGGSQLPCLRFTWTPPDDPTIVSVNITYEIVGGDQSFSAVSNDPESGLKLTTDNIVSGKVYRAKATITTNPDRFRTETPWVTAAVPTANMNVLDDSITAAKIAAAAVTADKIMNDAVTSLKLANQAVTTAKLQVGAVTEQVLANGAVIASKLADAAVTAQKLADAAVTATKFASGIKPVEVVGSLPTTGNTEGRQAYLTTDGKLYRYRNGAWTAEVSATDLVGQLLANQLADGAVTNSKLAALAVDAAKLAANAVTETKIADNAITTPKIVANAIVGDHIAANAISVTKLIMADFNNRVENPNFGEGNVGWYMAPGVSIVNNPANAYIGNFYMELPTGAQTGINRNANIFPVVPGETYRVHAVCRAVGNPNATLFARLRFLAADKNTLVGAANPVSFTSADAAYVGKTGQATAPPGAVYAWLDLFLSATLTSGGFRAGFVSCQRKDAAELVVDGSIVADHLAVNSVTADKLAANAVVAGKIAAGAVAADQIAANAITASKIAAGAISADKLAVGRGANYIENSDLYAGLTTWGTRYSNAPSAFVVSLRTDNYAASGAAIQIRHTRAVAGEVFDVWPADLGTGTGKNYPVEGGKRYEFSIYGFAHRAARQLYIGWVDAAGAATYVASAAIPFEGGDPQSQLSNYTRSTLFATAPASAVKAHVFVRHMGTSSGTTDSYVWFRNAYFGEAGPNQNEPSPWSPSGTTLVDAGQIVTGAVITDKIASNAITTAKIAAGAVTATEIAAGAVTAVKIAAAAITGDKIAANTIGANNIAANAITAKQLVLTDFTNLIANGSFDEGTVNGYWTGVSGPGNFYVLTDPQYVQTGAFSAILQKSTGSETASILVDMLPDYDIAVKAGEVLYGETSIRTNQASQSGGAYFRVVWLDANKATISTSDVISNAPITGTFTLRSGKVTAPANAKFARIRLYHHNTSSINNLMWDRLILRRANAAELIVDGGITANKLNVNSLSAISANFGDAYFSGIARSVNGKLLLDFTNGGFEVFT